MRSILSAHRISPSNAGIAVWSINRNDLLCDINATNPMTPASVTKLISTFTALEAYGGDYHLSTTVYTDGTVTSDGVVKGNLYLRGSGDPLLRESDIDNLAEQILRTGIARVEGHVYGDGSVFDDTTSRWRYSGDRDEVQAMHPVTGLTIERNEFRVIVSAPRASGRACNIQLSPATDEVQIVNRATAGGRRGGVSASMQVDPSTGRITIVVSGSLRAGSTWTKSFPIEKPDWLAASVLKKKLEERGIDVSQNVALRRTPRGAKALAAVARPLADVVSHTNKYSDNFCAEHLFKLVGAADGSRSSAHTARQTIHSILRANDVGCATCKLNDGSGLSRRNLLTPMGIIDVLTHAQSCSIRDSFIGSLAIAGVDGTLRRRMINTPAYNNVVAKTGTLRNVSGLAGYVSTRDNETLAFCFFFNGTGGGYKNAEDDLAAELASFSWETYCR